MITILLAEDHNLIREGISGLLDKQADMQVVGQAENGRMAIRLAQELVPQVVLMDISMPDMNGIEATRRITRESANVRVLALSMYSDSHFVEEMFKAGASGYVHKSSDSDELLRGVRAVAQGRKFLGKGIVDIVVDRFVRDRLDEADSGSSALSSREQEVLQLVTEGKSTKEIAKTLDITVKTADAHRQRIMSKLDIHSVAELTKYAIREGITSILSQP